MPKRADPLSFQRLKNWKPNGPTEELIDGSVPGLRVRRLASGTLTWSLSVRIRGARKRISVGEGLSISEARERALSLRQRISLNEDPSLDRNRRRVGASTTDNDTKSLRAVIDRYFAGDGSSKKSAEAQKKHIFNVFSSLLDRPALEVTASDLQVVVDDYAFKSSAQHAAAYIRPVCKWAEKRKLMEGRFDLELPILAKDVNRSILSQKEVGQFLCNVTSDPHDMAALFMLLTAARREEVVSATWEEFELSTRVWTIPGSRRKDTRKARQRIAKPFEGHVIVLSAQAFAILGEAKGDEEHGLAFRGARGRKLQNWPRWTRRFQKRSGLQVTPHTLRRTAATLIGDLGFAPHVTKAVLGHTYLADPLISGYNQSRYAPEAEKALAALANHLDFLKLKTSTTASVS